MTMKRCAWVTPEPLYLEYHDEQWGVPVFEDDVLFEMLILEGAQAGLSWYTILNKRENYRCAFDRFDAEKVARYDQWKLHQLLQEPRIVRNRLKIEAAVENARAFLEVRSEMGRFSDYIWSFVDGTPRINRWKNLSEVPASTAVSDAMSKDLKQRGFKFVGTKVCYAYMQAVGMVNDHTIACFRHAEVCGIAKRLSQTVRPR